MADDGRCNAGIVQSVADNLGGFFRHLFPGVLIVGAAYVAYPCRLSWLKVDLDSWQRILIVAVIALTVGNIWFAINRYGVMQLSDYFMYLRRIPGPAQGEGPPQYRKDLGAYVAEWLCTSGIRKEAQQHVKFRSSSVVLLYIVGETGVAFCVGHEPCTQFARHTLLVLLVSGAILLAAFWQDMITRIINYHILESTKNNQPGGWALF